MMPDEPVAAGYLNKAPGYDLVVLPSGTAARLATNLSAIPRIGNYMTGFSARSVRKGRGTIGVAMVLSLDPSFASVPGVYDDFVDGFAGTRVPQQETLSGQRAAYFDNPDGVAELVWMQRTVIVVVYGRDHTAMDRLGSALIAANQ